MQDKFGYIIFINCEKRNCILTKWDHKFRPLQCLYKFLIISPDMVIEKRVHHKLLPYYIVSVAYMNKTSTFSLRKYLEAWVWYNLAPSIFNHANEIPSINNWPLVIQNLAIIKPDRLLEVPILLSKIMDMFTELIINAYNFPSSSTCIENMVVL